MHLSCLVNGCKVLLQSSLKGPHFVLDLILIAFIFYVNICLGRKSTVVRQENYPHVVDNQHGKKPEIHKGKKHKEGEIIDVKWENDKLK